MRDVVGHSLVFPQLQRSESGPGFQPGTIAEKNQKRIRAGTH